MNSIFEIASRIATPLALAGFFGAVFFLTLRQILQSRFITTVGRSDSARILLRIINLLFILCLVGMLLGFAGYILQTTRTDPEAGIVKTPVALRRSTDCRSSAWTEAWLGASPPRAGDPATPHKNSISDVVAERISIESSRLRENYETQILHEVSVGGHPMPTPLFVRAFWDIMIINNSDRDISIVSYNIQPLSQGLPAQGPYGESYAQGLYELATNNPIVLPLSITAGHALRLKACSFVVVLPYRIPTEVSKHWQRGLPSGKVAMWDLFYNYFASHGVDFFGNEVAPGPRGIRPVQNHGLQDQELAFQIRTGRGTIQAVTLKWY